MIPSVRAPASSANLGAGFDVFGMALSLGAEFGVGDPPGRAHAIGSDHPARIPFERLGGTGDLWLRTDIPMARGLGFSGAARVAAAGLGAVVAAGGSPDALGAARGDILRVATELEGHGDNVAASLDGGVTAYVGGAVHRLPLGPTMAAATCLAWVPSVRTSTDASRRTLSPTVERADAVANLGAVTQFVLAFAHDDPTLLSGATDDRLHQSDRLADIPDGAEAIAAGVGAGAWCAWLSGSGPTVAMLCDADRAEAVSSALPASGHVKRLRIDPVGVTVVESRPR